MVVRWRRAVHGYARGETKPWSGLRGRMGVAHSARSAAGSVSSSIDAMTANAPTKGFRLAAGGTVYPAIWDVESTFGEAHARASTY